MQVFKQQRALNFAVISFFIGICAVPLWFLFILLAETLWVYVPLIAALAGFVLGVIGLVLSIRKETRSVKGIAFASIGTVLNVISGAGAVRLLRMLTYTMDPM